MKRLCDIILRAEVKPGQHILLQIMGRQKEDGQIRSHGSGLTAQVEAVPVRKVYIQQNQVKRVAPKQLPGLLAGVRGDCQITAAVQLKTQPGTQGQIILHNQDACHFFRLLAFFVTSHGTL